MIAHLSQLFVDSRLFLVSRMEMAGLAAGAVAAAGTDTIFPVADDLADCQDNGGQHEKPYD